MYICELIFKNRDMIDPTLNPSLEEKSTDQNSEMNVETTPVNENAESSEAVEEAAAGENAEAPVQGGMRGPLISEAELKSLASKSLKEIVDTFRNLVENGEIMELNRQAESIKATFYKVLKEEKIASGFVAPAEEVAQSADTPETGAADEALEDGTAGKESVEVKAETAEEPATASVNPFIEIERAFKELYASYRSRRSAYFNNLEKEKQDNLEKKLKIIEEMKELSETTEDLNRTFPAFRELQARWRETGLVPQARVKDVYETYQHYVEKFYDYVKINNELRDLDFKKNLEKKIELCERAEALAAETNVVEAFAQLQKLHDEWKEYGPVAKEFREEIWERFRVATAAVNKLHQSYFEGLKAQQKENLIAKTALCEKAEEIASREISDSNGWNSTAKELEEIQKEWRKIGFASKKENQKIYDRFRAACDKFYNSKREFYVDFKEQMVDNLAKKVALCEKAEAVTDSTDWKATTDYLISLQKEWKSIGPVSRKKSDQIWARFRAACDKFFDNKEKNYGGVDPQYVDNLKAKLAIIDEIGAYESKGGSEDGFAAKEFLSRWNSVGFVPFKEKESVQEKFRAAMSDKFPDFKIGGGSPRGRERGRGRGDRQVSPIRQERDMLVQKYNKLQNEIATYENNLGFFANSKNADKLIQGFMKKIEAAKEELAELEEKIQKLDNQE